MLRRHYLALILVVSAAVLAAATGVARTPVVAQASRFTISLPYIVRAETPPPQPTTSNNLQIAAASFFGAAGADTAEAVDVAPDGTIVLAGSFLNYVPTAITPIDLTPDTGGSVFRISNDGTQILSQTRFGTTLTDLEIAPNGSILICGDAGIALLSADASTALWQATPGSVKRCALGNDSSAAALVGNQITVYTITGAVVGSWSLGTGTHNDVAVASAEGIIVATGFRQVSSNLQLPYLRGYSYAGELVWTSYDWDAAPNLGADTRGERVAIGRDGKLYMAGSINGGTGASVFSRDPKDLSVRLDRERLITTDTYNNPTNVGSVKMAWFGRFHAADGTLLQSQSLLTRLSNGRGNSISILAITADEYGNVFIAGSTSASIQNRDTRQVAGITVGSYAGGEPYFLVISSNLRQRHIWSPFAAPGGSAGNSPANGVAVRRGTAAIAITLTQGGLITKPPLNPTPAELSDAYLAIWPVQ